MAASFNDMAVLAADTTFQNRVKAAMITGAVVVSAENKSTVAFHRERETYAVQVMNSPDTYKVLFANAIATDATVLADATQAGTVALTTGNVATQQALVTDAHITTALGLVFNAFFRMPAS